MNTLINISSSAHIALDTLRTSHLLVQGASGSGKSYLNRVLAEQLCQHIQTIIIDPEGEYHTLREKFPFILVGEGGETPASIDTAELLARRLVEIGASAICDLYALEKDQQQVWLQKFLSALMRLPRSLWHPLVIIIDEAHLFCPEKGEGSAASTKAVEDLCSRGRKHGIGIILSTQRITKLSNNAASELQNYVIGRTFIQTDRERAAKVLGIPHRVAEMEAFYRDLKVLQPGQFWALGVAISTERVMVTVNQAQTTHPEPGALTEHKPPTPEHVSKLLPQLSDLPKEVEQEQSEVDRLRQDVSRLMDENADLVQQLTSREPQVITPDFSDLKQRVAEMESGYQEWMNKLESIIASRLKTVADSLQTVGAELREEVTNLQAELLNDLSGLAFNLDDDAPVPEIRQMAVAPAPRISIPDPGPSLGCRPITTPARETNGGLNSTARKMLSTLVQWHPRGLSRGQLAAFVGIKSNTGSYGNRLSDLRTAGFMSESDGKIFATDAGCRFIGKDRQPAPRTSREVMALWQGKLNSTAYRLLEILVEHRGRPVHRADLAKRAGISPDTGSYGNRLSELRTALLMVDVERGYVAANRETLFL